MNEVAVLEKEVTAEELALRLLKVADDPDAPQLVPLKSAATLARALVVAPRLLDAARAVIKARQARIDSKRFPVCDNRRVADAGYERAALSRALDDLTAAVDTLDARARIPTQQREASVDE